MDNWLAIVISLSYLVLFLSLMMAFIRMALGPTLADRVVALDLIAFITIGFIAVYTLDSGQRAFLDVAITLGLVAFLGTVVFARLIAKRVSEERE
ncbi:cation:proton antiporter [Motilimonas sp. KMU-193]|uniref:cation:proton antiporter n=1 Tax=Motilimonas sp. KMU-193 TaxID=3388668 RepID=UPI00396B0BDA